MAITADEAPAARADWHRALDALLDQVDAASKLPARRPLSTLRSGSQADLAKALGLSQPTVSNIERVSTTGGRQKRPGVLTLGTLRAYVEGCGYSLELVPMAVAPSGEAIALDVRLHIEEG